MTATSETTGEWHTLTISALSTANRVLESISRVCSMLSGIAYAPAKVRVLYCSLDQLKSILQSFLEILKGIRITDGCGRKTISTLEVTAKHLLIFDDALPRYEELVRELVYKHRRRSMFGMIHFELFGCNEVKKFQLAIPRIESHVTMSCASLIASVSRQEKKSEQENYHDIQVLDQYETLREPTLAELSGLSEIRPVSNYRLDSKGLAVGLGGSGVMAAELKGSLLPFPAISSKATEPTACDGKQINIRAVTKDVYELDGQDPKCDKSDLQPSLIMPDPDLCISTCHLEQHQSSPTLVTSELLRSPRPFSCISTATHRSFSIGPVGWMDPITLYCCAVSKQFICKLCGCYSDQRYSNYRACLEKSSDYRWYLQYRFGKLLLELRLPVEVYRAIYTVPPACTKPSMILVYFLADCVVLASDRILSTLPSLKPRGCLGRPEVDLQPFARIHFSAIEHLTTLRGEDLVMILKETPNTGLCSLFLRFDNVDDRKRAAKLVTYWLKLNPRSTRKVGKKCQRPLSHS